MSSRKPRKGSAWRIVAVLAGIALYVFLIERAGPAQLLHNARKVGLGMLLVIGLAGFAHLVKAFAWRLALRSDAKKTSFWRILGLRLVSEAIGQFGFVGLVFGESTRAALLGPQVSMANAISSVALDRGLFMVTGAVVTIVGLTTTILVVAVTAPLRVYAMAVVFVLLSLLGMSVLAVSRNWPFLTGTVRLAGVVPGLRAWLNSKKTVIESAEQQLLSFHREAPAAFWGALILNFATQLLAVTEVYLILQLLGSHASFLIALILESLTKLINIIGVINPGNLGTYEGGNMMIGKLVDLSGSQGFTIALCRRMRAIFWAAVGGLCLGWFLRSRRHGNIQSEQEIDMKLLETPVDEKKQAALPAHQHDTVIILAHHLPWSRSFQSVLARIGSLPVLLRAILGVQATKPERIVVVVDPVAAPQIRWDLSRTRRLPDRIEWLEVETGATLSSVFRQAIPTTSDGRVIVVAGNRTYQPALHRMVSERSRPGCALELTTESEPVGLSALSYETACELAADRESTAVTMQDLHRWISRKAISNRLDAVDIRAVEENSYQQISNSQDCIVAEQKLNAWLVKPTDGIFARMNRQISIPISRQLIKYPITPNMVTLFTLGVSFAAGALYARGGYLYTLAGAILSVWASILDGCDGEVARLKLQATKFGCWLETACDYLYYFFIFAGMAIGLARSTGNSAYLAWGGALLFGAVATVVVACFERSRLSSAHPEQFLAVWQQKAERRSSNPLLYIGRRCEFIIRRCFLPYALLAFAVLNLSRMALYMTAIGANVAWIISLYSRFAFSSPPRVSAKAPAAADTEPLIV